MNPFLPLYGIVFEIRREWIEIGDHVEAPQSELLANHQASVAEFLAYKAEHPRDGTMVTLYRWAPVMVVAASFLTMNPLGIAMGLAYAARRWR